MPLTNKRNEYIPAEEILIEAEQILKSRANDGIDWVTFVGSGEPTLHIRIGWLIRQIKSMTNKPVAVITNGSLLYLPEVREELLAADAILPTLDAGTETLYRKINRPHPDATFKRLVEGLTAFRQEYQGKLWVEVMLVRGLNNSTQALEDIAKVIQGLKPDAVHINLPTRPPAETWIQLPDGEDLMRAISILGNIAEVVHPAEGIFDLSGYKSAADAIIGIITRHPMRQDELIRTLTCWTPEKVDEALADLEKSGRAQTVDRLGFRFWSATPSIYPDEVRSQQTNPSDFSKREKKETT